MQYIYHYGVKGMKWGIRRTPEELGHKKIKTESLDSFKMSKEKVMLGKTPAVLYEWKDSDGKLVAEFKIWNWWDGINVSDLEIHGDHKGKRLSYQLLDYATKELGARNLAVKKDNEIAKHVYNKYGFMITDQDDEMYYMSLKKEK